MLTCIEGELSNTPAQPAQNPPPRTPNTPGKRSGTRAANAASGEKLADPTVYLPVRAPSTPTPSRRRNIQHTVIPASPSNAGSFFGGFGSSSEPMADIQMGSSSTAPTRPPTFSFGLSNLTAGRRAQVGPQAGFINEPDNDLYGVSDKEDGAPPASAEDVTISPPATNVVASVIPTSIVGAGLPKSSQMNLWSGSHQWKRRRRIGIISDCLAGPLLVASWPTIKQLLVTKDVVKNVFVRPNLRVKFPPVLLRARSRMGR